MYLTNQILFNKQILLFFSLFQFFFPTCQVRILGSYFNCHASSSFSRLLLFLLFLFLVVRSHAQCSLPDLNQESFHPTFFIRQRKLFPSTKTKLSEILFVKDCNLHKSVQKTSKCFSLEKTKDSLWKHNHAGTKRFHQVTPSFLHTTKIQEALPNTSEDISDRILEDMSNRIQKI